MLYCFWSYLTCNEYYRKHCLPSLLQMVPDSEGRRPQRRASSRSGAYILAVQKSLALRLAWESRVQFTRAGGVTHMQSKVLNERKGIGHTLVDLAAAEHVMSNGLLTERIQRHTPLSCNGKISTYRKYRLSAKCVPWSPDLDSSQWQSREPSYIAWMRIATSW